MMIKKIITATFFIFTTTLFAQQAIPLTLRPIVHLVSDHHHNNACKTQRKQLLNMANRGEHYVGFEGLYDKRYIEYYVQGLGDFEFALNSTQNTIYPLENALVFKFGRVLSLIQALDQTIRIRMNEMFKRARNESYNQELIDFYAQRLSIKFAELQNLYAGDKLLRQKFKDYLGISLELYVTNNQNINKAIQAKYPNILDFIDSFNRGFVWDELRSMNSNNLISSYLQSVHTSLPTQLKNNSVILDVETQAKAKQKAKELEHLKTSRDNFSRSQPDYWLYTIYWRNQTFINVFERMHSDWQGNADNMDKDIYMVVGADHIQDLHDRLLNQFAIDAQIDASCHE